MQPFARVLFLLTVAAWLLQQSPHQAVGSAPALPDRQNRSAQILAIVVNQSNPVEDLSFVELRRIFLGRRSRWPNGRRIAVVMMDHGQPERETVLRQIYRMSESEYRDHFVRGLYTGDVLVSPKILASPTVVRKFVFNAPGAIGYLRASDVDQSVKAIRIDGVSPLDHDYRFQIDAVAAE